MTITKQIIEILSNRNMTARQLQAELGYENKRESVHYVINALKKRKALEVVGKAYEVNKCNHAMCVSIYSYVAPIKPLKLKETKRSRYRADLSRAINNKERFKEMLLKKNYLFMLYAKELGLKYESA
jgi:hypothetical protein